MALLAGVGLSAAFEPLAWRWALLPALVGFFLVLRCQPVRRSILIGTCFGAGFMFTHQVWMRAIGPDAYIAISLLETSFFAVLGGCLAWTGRLRGWPLWWATLWVAVETWRTQWPFGGMPWGRLSFAVMDTSASGWLPWIGTTGVSLLQALAAASGAWLLSQVGSALAARRRRSRPIHEAPSAPPRASRPRRLPALTVALAAAPLIAVFLPPGAPASSAGDTVDLAAIQGEVPGDGTDVLLDHRRITRTLSEQTIALAGQADRPDLVVWPENSTAIDPFANSDVHALITAAVDTIGAPVLVGTMVDGPTEGTVLNQGIVWEAESGAGDRYTKRHPVPYGEFIPYREQLPFTATFGQLRLIQRDMMSGTRIRPLEVQTASGSLRISDAICFDVGYDEGGYAQLRQGVDLLVVQTSNAMFVHTAQIRQQFEISRVRAAEAGKFLVVASMNGVSGIIGPDGAVLQQAPTLHTTILRADVPRLYGVPPAARVGPALTWVSLGLALVGLLLGATTYRRRQPDPQSEPVEPSRKVGAR